jgi:hypothetical protein
LFRKKCRPVSETYRSLSQYPNAGTEPHRALKVDLETLMPRRRPAAVQLDLFVADLQEIAFLDQLANAAVNLMQLPMHRSIRAWQKSLLRSDFFAVNPSFTGPRH